jgi:Flp pilus assembly protein TadD
MKHNWQRLVAPVLVGAALFSMLWWLNRKSNSGAAPMGSMDSIKAGKSADPRVERIHETASLEAELKKNPGHPPILMRLADLAREDGKKTEAIKFLRLALDADQSNAEARLELGRALFEMGQSDAAIAETRKIIEVQPKHVDALYNLGAMYGNMGQDALARQYFEKAVAAGPDSDSGRKSKEALTRLPR